MKSFERLLSLLSTIPDPRRASRIRKNPGIFASLRSFGYNRPRLALHHRCLMDQHLSEASQRRQINPARRLTQPGQAV